jgi:hypothetical protein
MSEEPKSGKPRIAALVGLSLLEVIRNRDLPPEIIDAEDPALTMPRRLGLTEAVELQIRRYREEVRRKERMTDEEARALFELVLRRPDSTEVFLQAGEILAGKDAPVGGLTRWLPKGVRFALARRQFRKQLRTLFGRSIGGFAKGPFVLEASGHFFMELDGGGDACAILSGIAQTTVSRYLRAPFRVIHPSCIARTDELCRWTVTADGGGSETATMEGTHGREG